MSRLASVTSLFNNVKCSKFFFLFYCKLKEKYVIRRQSLCNKKSSCRGLLETPYVLNVADQFSQTSGIEFFFINNNKKKIGSFCRVLDVVCLKKTVHLFCLEIKWL